MTTRRIRLSGPGARGVRIGGTLLRGWLDVLVGACRQAVRLQLRPGR